METLKKSI